MTEPKIVQTEAIADQEFAAAEAVAVESRIEPRVWFESLTDEDCRLPSEKDYKSD